jgi:hypothetical protein
MDRCRKTDLAGGMRPSPALALGAALLFSIGGCAQPQLFQPRATSAPSTQQSKMSKEELHDALDDFKDVFDSTVKQAAAKIDGTTPDSATRKNTLLWQVRMIDACFTICKQEDDLKVFLDLWTMCIRMNQYFQTGDGRDLFREQQDVAVAAAQKLQDEIERIGKSFMSEEQLAKARKDAEAFAAANPIRAGFNGAVIRTTATSTPAGVPNAFNTILGIPLTPFRAIEGVDRGAEAIRGFTKVADRFTDDFEALPESIRWQLMLLLIDLEENKMISSALASFEQFSRSSAQLAQTADKLPEELRRQASGLIEEVDSKQGNIQTTLTQAEKTANAIERTGQSVADAGWAWAATAKTIGQTIDSIRYGRDAAPAAATAAPPAPAPVKVAPPAAPADQSADDSSAAAYLDDYRRTAETLTATATELRLFTEEARKLIESPQLTEQIRDVDSRMVGAVNLTAQQAQGLTDHIAWRSTQLILLIFVLAFVYRALSRRLFKRAA